MNWKDIILDDFILLDKDFNSPESAVKFIGDLFEKKQYSTKHYTQAMLNTLEKYKSIIVLDDGIAMPHARPEEGALKEGLVFIQLRSELDFGNTDFDAVKFLIGLVSTGSENHIKLIQLVGNLIENEIQHKNFNSNHELKDFIYHIIQQEGL